MSLLDQDASSLCHFPVASENRGQGVGDLVDQILPCCPCTLKRRSCGWRDCLGDRCTRRPHIGAQEAASFQKLERSLSLPFPGLIQLVRGMIVFLLVPPGRRRQPVVLTAAAWCRTRWGPRHYFHLGLHWEQATLSLLLRLVHHRHLPIVNDTSRASSCARS